MPVTFALSRTLKDCKVVIQYTRSNTVLIQYHDIKTVLSPCYTVLFCSPAVQKVFPDITLTDTDEHLSQAVRALVAQHNERLDHETSLNYALDRHHKTTQE